MIYIARLYSVVGALLMNFCLIVLGFKFFLDDHLPKALQGHWALIFVTMGIAAFLIFLARRLGSDLYVRRRESGKPDASIAYDLLLWHSFHARYGDDSDTDGGWFGGDGGTSGGDAGGAD